MTDKQVQKSKDIIANYKKALAADKKQWGGYYHDGNAIRYLPPEQYIKIEDYKGALAYFKWFHKNFPDDVAHAQFLFEWAFVLFKCQKLQEAELKASNAFFSNVYLFDVFFEKEVVELEQVEHSSWKIANLNKYFSYKKSQKKFSEFAIWIEAILSSKAFLDKIELFFAIETQLKTEPLGEKRRQLVQQYYEMQYS